MSVLPFYYQVYTSLTVTVLLPINPEPWELRFNEEAEDPVRDFYLLAHIENYNSQGSLGTTLKLLCLHSAGLSWERKWKRDMTLHRFGMCQFHTWESLTKLKLSGNGHSPIHSHVIAYVLSTMEVKKSRAEVDRKRSLD